MTSFNTFDLLGEIFFSILYNSHIPDFLNQRMCEIFHRVLFLYVSFKAEVMTYHKIGHNDN